MPATAGMEGETLYRLSGVPRLGHAQNLCALPQAPPAHAERFGEVCPADGRQDRIFATDALIVYLALIATRPHLRATRAKLARSKTERTSAHMKFSGELIHAIGITCCGITLEHHLIHLPRPV